MKLEIGVLLGCVVIALSLYMGLTYDKRTWMESCISQQGHTVDFCEMAYRSSPK